MHGNSCFEMMTNSFLQGNGLMASAHNCLRSVKVRQFTTVEIYHNEMFTNGFVNNNWKDNKWFPMRSAAPCDIIFQAKTSYDLFKSKSLPMLYKN